MEKSILFVDQFREITGGQVVLQSLVKVARDEGYRVGVLAPMGGALESVLQKRWDREVARYDLHELALQSGRKGWRDALRLLAFSFYLLRFLRLVSSYEVIYVNGGRLALPCALLSLPRSARAGFITCTFAIAGSRKGSLNSSRGCLAPIVSCWHRAISRRTLRASGRRSRATGACASSKTV